MYHQIFEIITKLINVVILYRQLMSNIDNEAGKFVASLYRPRVAVVGTRRLRCSD